MRITEARLLALDTETTDSNPAEARIVQLGGAYVGAGGRLGDRLSVLVNPGVYIPPKAVQIHGIIDKMVADAPSWGQVLPRLRARVEDRAQPVVPCGYNFIYYDLPVIEAENARAGMRWRMPPVLDAKIWVDWHHRDARPRSLGNMCSVYGIELPTDRAHTADADALATGLLLMAMVEAGLIPDDIERAFVEQARIQRTVEAEFAEFGYHLYRDRQPGADRLMLGFGQHIGTPLDEAEEKYRRWIMSQSEVTPAAKEAVRVSLGVVEQISLF